MKLSKTPKRVERELSGELKRFEKWFEKRKITADLKTVSPTDLSEILRK